MRISSDSFCVVLISVVKWLVWCQVVFNYFVLVGGRFNVALGYGLYAVLCGVCFVVGLAEA